MNKGKLFGEASGATQPKPSRQQLGRGTLTEIESTANFRIFAQDAMGARGLDIARSLRTHCEADYAKVRNYFGVVPAGLQFRAIVTQDVSGAMHFTCGDVELYVGTIGNVPPAHAGFPLLLVAEVVEVLEATINNGWDCGANNGEALSRALANDVYDKFPDPHDVLVDSVTSRIWLDETTPGGRRRPNWVDNVDPEDTDDFSIGCSVLFLNWLRFVLGFTWNQIISNGATTLAGTYRKLTGRNDAWQRFDDEMEARFPRARPSGLTTDNPFPR